ncbi:unnamed protein product [Notodromas monacha]|uniref:Uncharacterized protein n=1 Tax=Notodromas monacha TaxID=399045 RepID=A0A7R9BBP1_9CRUS|nr:unnamed protein product [Notodromas monacha]CAG0912342.1 unnamed protein product [Notodromas monacha]
MSIGPIVGLFLCCSAALISFGSEWITASVYHGDRSTLSTNGSLAGGKHRRVELVFQPRLWQSIVRCSTYTVGTLLLFCPRKSLIVIYGTASSLFAVLGLIVKHTDQWFPLGTSVFLGLTSAMGAVAVLGVFALLPVEFSTHSSTHDSFLGFTLFALQAGADWLLWTVAHLKSDVLSSASPTIPSPYAPEMATTSDVTFLPCCANVPVAAVAGFFWIMDWKQQSAAYRDSKAWRADAGCARAACHRRNLPLLCVVATMFACSLLRHAGFSALLANIEEDLATKSTGRDYRLAFCLSFLPDLLGTLLAVGLHAGKSPLARYVAPFGAFFFSLAVAGLFLFMKFHRGTDFWFFVVMDMWIRFFHQMFIASGFLSVRRLRFRQSLGAQFVALSGLLTVMELGRLTSEIIRVWIPDSLEETEYRLIMGAAVACMLSLTLLSFGKNYGDYFRLRGAHVNATDDIVFFHSGNRSAPLAMTTPKSFVFESQNSINDAVPDSIWGTELALHQPSRRQSDPGLIC